MHGLPLGPVDPILQVQESSAELEVGELERVGHIRQVVAATVLEYVPSLQLVHCKVPVLFL